VVDTIHPRCQRALIDEHREELTALLRWARTEPFGRREVNQRLRHAPGGTLANWSLLG
jgi:hypothetical protein